MIDFLPLLLQPGRHPPDAIKRRARVLLIKQAHQQQIGFAFRLRLIIETAARQPEQLTLPSETELLMVDVNQLP